jgi:hypothetical protein
LPQNQPSMRQNQLVAHAPRAENTSNTRDDMSAGSSCPLQQQGETMATSKQHTQYTNSFQHITPYTPHIHHTPVPAIPYTSHTQVPASPFPPHTLQSLPAQSHPTHTSPAHLDGHLSLQRLQASGSEHQTHCPCHLQQHVVQGVMTQLPGNVPHVVHRPKARREGGASPLQGPTHTPVPDNTGTTWGGGWGGRW